MNCTLPTILFVALLLGYQPAARGQATDAQRVILDFEGTEPIANNSTTHPATVSRADDAPRDGGQSAASTKVDSDADADQYFGTAFRFASVDLSTYREVRLWIKTDIESAMNLQVHSGGDGVSVFQFRTAGSGQWKQIKAPRREFTQPRWSKKEVDWAHVTQFQITAFQSGPYDGKQLVVDQFSVAETSSGNSQRGPELRGGPIHLATPEPKSVPKSPPPGFRSLFNGKTLDGWTAKARLPVPNYPGAEFKWRLEGEALEKAKKNTGQWRVENGAIVGGQDPPGSGKGSLFGLESKVR